MLESPLAQTIIRHGLKFISELGTPRMKIALLGPSASGKTVYFSGLAYKYRNFIGFRPLSKRDSEFYRREDVRRRVALQLGFLNSEHEREINNHISLLAQRPIREWPEATIDLDKSDLRTEFHFTDAFDEDDPIETFLRSIAIYDPPGEALVGRHQDSKDIVESLCGCDVAMAFLPADLIIDAAESDDADRVLNGAYFGKIKEIILSCAAKIERDDANDIMPVCIVVSKADLLQNLPENVINDVRDMLYNQIIKPFSKTNSKLMICVCPVSVLNPADGNFEASNLEWPFMFAVAGSIYRNSLVLRDKAAAARKSGEESEKSAQDLRSQGLTWERFLAWANNNGARERTKRAQSYFSQYGRLVAEAEDDRALAKAALMALSVEGQARQVKIYIKGKELDATRMAGEL